MRIYNEYARAGGVSGGEGASPGIDYSPKNDHRMILRTDERDELSAVTQRLKNDPRCKVRTDCVRVHLSLV